MIMEEQYCTRIRVNNTDSVDDDRISGLPDCILADILSFLPTKQAVATSLLSKRWKSSWLDVHSLEFSSPDPADNTAFIRFVNSALLFINGRRPINKFSLVWSSGVIASHLICWIDAAILRRVSQIHLSLYLDNEFPITGFNCDSLQSLQLEGITFVYDETAAVCLPRLETLILYDAYFTSDEAFEKLINGCPMLHSFELSVCSSSNEDFDDYYGIEEDFMYLVSSPSLRRLCLYTVDRCTLKLNAPSLVYLRLTGPVYEIYVGKSLTSLNQAFFDLEPDARHLFMSNVVDPHHLLMPNAHDFPYISIAEAVRALEHAKFLTLSAHVMRALSHGRIKLSTKFDSLVKLETAIYYCDWRSLLDLIQCSDNLQLLTINQGSQLRGSNHRNRLKWTTPAEVPRCLLMSLKKIVFNGYLGSDKDEDEMIRYMSTNASVLEMMHITCPGMMTTSRFKSVQKIGEYPIKSPLCVVKFSGSMPNGNDVEVGFTARPFED